MRFCIIYSPSLVFPQHRPLAHQRGLLRLLGILSQMSASDYLETTFILLTALCNNTNIWIGEVCTELRSCMTEKCCIRNVLMGKYHKKSRGSFYLIWYLGSIQVANCINLAHMKHLGFPRIARERIAGKNSYRCSTKSLRTFVR